MDSKNYNEFGKERSVHTTSVIRFFRNSLSLINCLYKGLDRTKERNHYHSDE